MRSLTVPLMSVWVLFASLVMPAAAQQNVHNFNYDPATGNLSLDNQGAPLTALEILSTSGVFTGARPAVVNGLFDVFQPTKMFWLFPTGFDDTDFGPAMTPGLSQDFLESDLRFSGALRPQGRLGQINIIVNGYTPSILRYDSLTGAMSFEQPDDPNEVKHLTSIVIDSASGVFTGQRPATLTNDFDVFRENRLFKMDVAGFEEVDFGTPAATGWTDENLAKDLCIGGSVLGGGKLSGVRLNSESGPFVKSCDTRPNMGGDAPPPIYLYAGYNFQNGQMLISTSGQSMTALEIRSADNLFTGPRPTNLSGPSDIFASNRIYKLDTNGFLSLDLGPALPSGVPYEQVQSLQFSVSFSPDGAFEDVPVVLYFVPEPSTTLLLGLASSVTALRHARRRRSRV